MNFNNQIINDFYRDKEVKMNKNIIAELNWFNDENLFGSTPDASGKNTTILHILCRGNIPLAFELFDRLIDLGANINAIDDRNHSVLDVAISSEKIHFINLIINNKNFNGSEKLYTDTMKKIQFMNPQDDNIYELLKSKGGKVDLNHIIDNLVYMSKTLVIKYVFLLISEMDVNINYITPNGSYIIKQMIMNEDKSEYNNKTSKPIKNYSYKNITLWDKVCILLESDPTININRVNCNGENLMWDVIASELYTDQQKWNMIIALQKFGLDINHVNKDGENILFKVTSNSYLLGRLIDIGIEVNITTLLEKVMESYSVVHSEEYEKLLNICDKFKHKTKS